MNRDPKSSRLMTFDADIEVLYVAKLRWIEDGRGAIDRADSKEVPGDFKDLVALRSDRFDS